MNKIIGFLITPQKSKPNIDFFNAGLKIEESKYKNFYIYLWGFGELAKCKINSDYSLSFPLHNSLLDKNLLISFKDENIIIKNDWLGSIPVFYNSKEKIISSLSNFCLKDKEIHQEGLSNYFEFGFSVFEQTPFKNVQFMRYYSDIILNKDNLEIIHKKDPILEKDFLSQPSKEKEVIQEMKNYVEKQEKEIKEDILLPLSGGYDSRLLAYLVKDKSKVKSFTYGISKNPSKSDEVVRAKKISEIYNIDWQQISTQNYFKKKYLEKWFKLYGFASHLHGMQAIEFHENIAKEKPNYDFSLLSGIHGGLYTGQVGKYKEVKSYKDIINLSFNHNLCLNKNYYSKKNNQKLKKIFFNQIKDSIENDKIKSIFTVRIKGMLISYLTTIPEYFKIPVWTPFLNFNIIKSIVNIPEERRNNRVWKKDFFKKVGLNVEDMGLKSSKINVQDLETLRQSTISPIDVEEMQKFVKKKRLLEINQILKNKKLVN